MLSIAGKTVFIVSHIDSSYISLVHALKSYDSVDGEYVETTIDHPSRLNDIHRIKHKCSNAKAIYLGQLLYNHNFTCRATSNMCKFVYLIDLPSPNVDITYYKMRLFGIYKLATRTPHAIGFTHSGLIKNYKYLFPFMGLKDKELHFESNENQGLNGLFEFYIDKFSKLNFPFFS